MVVPSGYLESPCLYDKPILYPDHVLYLFGLQYSKILSDINRNIKLPEDNKLKHVCIILKLIMDCDFRVGNDEYMKQNNSYGVSTLKTKHVIIRGDKVTIDFIGKKSVRNVCVVKDKTIKKHLKKQKKTLKKITPREFSRN